MAQNPPRKQSSRKQNEISSPENDGVPTRFNNPAVTTRIADARADLEREKGSDRIKFEVAFNDAERLHYVRTELDFSTEQVVEFALACGRPRSTAADLLKIHGRRDDGMRWFEARVTLAEGKRVNLRWQAYARDRKLIVRKPTQGKRGVPSADATNKDKQIIDLTKERDGLKDKLTKAERERDDMKAELDRLRSQD